jgi:RND family efflux transporter MFP subunit
VIICLLTAILAVSGCGKAQQAVKEAEITVNTAPAQIQDLAKSVSYSGIIRGKNEVYLMPKVSARVTGIAVKAGDTVKTGQTLITLDNTDFIAGVQQAEAGLAMAEAGQRANQMQVESALADYERAQALYAAGAIADQQLELARLKYESLTAGSAEAAVAQAQAALSAARTLLAKCVITSPLDGVVGSIGVSLGDTANPAAVAAIVSDTSELQVQVMVSEAEVSYIQPGSAVQVYISAVQEQAFPGKVESIASVADPVTHNFAVKVDLPNPEGRIKSGMFAELKVDTLSKQGILVIPVSAVVPKGGQQIVFVVDQDQRARETEVTTGIKNDNYIEILSGLQAGQEVIIKGNTLVSDGTLVRVVAGGTQ